MATYHGLFWLCPVTFLFLISVVTIMALILNRRSPPFNTAFFKLFTNCCIINLLSVLLYWVFHKLDYMEWVSADEV